VITVALYSLPIGILQLKIAPKGLEATSLSFFATVNNISNLILSPAVGNKVNEAFIHVSKENMSSIYKIPMVTIIFSLPYFFAVILIPSLKSLWKFDKQ
jgi:hypothetical protein